MRFTLRILVIVAASIAAGAASRAWRFSAVPWVLPADDLRGDPQRLRALDIGLDELKKLIAQADAGGSVVLIDARESDEFAAGHIPCANTLNVPADSAADHVGRLTAYDGWTMVLYCTSRNCDAAQRVYNTLNASGFTNLKIYEDGWDGWTRAKLPAATTGEMLLGDPVAAAGEESGAQQDATGVTDDAGDDSADAEMPPADAGGGG